MDRDPDVKFISVKENPNAGCQFVIEFHFSKYKCMHDHHDRTIRHFAKVQGGIPGTPYPIIFETFGPEEEE